MARMSPRTLVGRFLAISALAIQLVLGIGSPSDASAADYSVYSQGLASGWQNWSWNSWVNFSGFGTAGTGAGIGWQIAAAWGALYLHTDTAVQTTSGSALQFALMGSQANQRLSISVYGDNGHIAGWSRMLSDFGGFPTPGQWKWYWVPLSGLGAAGARVTGIVMQDANGWPQPTIELDEITLTSSTSGFTQTTSGNCLGVAAYPEIRWENAAQNATPGRHSNPSAFWGNTAWRWYYDQINGACTGTTEQILEWAAKKWGFDQLGYPDLAKAQAAVETWWREAFIGSAGEVGILQIHPAFWPDYQPATWSTGYAADYAMAAIRAFYDGAGWLGGATKGDVWGSVAAWNCGCAYNGNGWYANQIKTYLNTKPWKRPGQPPEWF